MAPLLHEPFFQVTIPMMATLIAGVWAMISTNNRRIDDLNANFNRRLDAVAAPLGRIEDLLRNHDEPLARLEERTSPISRR